MGERLAEGHVQDVQWFISELEFISQQVDREVKELEDFIAGRRKSPYKLGRKFLLKRGTELDQLRLELELRLKG